AGPDAALDEGEAFGHAGMGGVAGLETTANLAHALLQRAEAIGEDRERLDQAGLVVGQRAVFLEQRGVERRRLQAGLELAVDAVEDRIDTAIDEAEAVAEVTEAAAELLD